MGLFQQIYVFMQFITEISKEKGSNQEMDQIIRQVFYTQRNIALIKQILQEEGIYYLQDKENGNCFFCSMGSGDETAIVSGKDASMYLKVSDNSIHVQTFLRNNLIESTKFTKALVFCNQWNRKHNLLKSHVDPIQNIIIGELLFIFSPDTPEDTIHYLLTTIAVPMSKQYIQVIRNEDF